MNYFKKILYYRYNPHMIDVSFRYWKKRKKTNLLNVAVIGCGGGGMMHMSHYIWHKRTNLKYVFDVESDRFKDIKKRFPFAYNHIKKTTKIDDLINDESVDIISVATPDHTHAKYAIMALDSGKNVLCEKPMCTSIEDAKKMIKSVNASKKKFSVFQQMRFTPKNAKAYEFINKDKLGELFYIRTEYIHDMRSRATEFSNWRKDPKTFQHPIYGGQHNIDLIRWLAGDITEVYAISSGKGFPNYPIHDTFTIQAKFKNGCIGNIITSYGPIVPKEFHLLNIYGTKGTMHNNNIYFEEKSIMKNTILDNAEYNGVPQFRDQISLFVNCVLNDSEQGLVSVLDGAKTVMIIEACLESLITGKPSKVKNID